MLLRTSKVALKLRGDVEMFETPVGILLPKSQELRGREDLMIPWTHKKDHNTIYTDLKAYLAYKIGTNTVDQTMDNLFTAQTLATQNGKDGMCQASTSYANSTDTVFITTLNDGGDNSDEFIEFYGYITGETSLAPTLILGYNMLATTTKQFTKLYAHYTINTTVAASRNYHFYWKLSFA
jgi:hypothetical protein